MKNKNLFFLLIAGLLTLPFLGNAQTTTYQSANFSKTTNGSCTSYSYQGSFATQNAAIAASMISLETCLSSAGYKKVPVFLSDNCWPNNMTQPSTCVQLTSCYFINGTNSCYLRMNNSQNNTIWRGAQNDNPKVWVKDTTTVAYTLSSRTYSGSVFTAIYLNQSQNPSEINFESITYQNTGNTCGYYQPICYQNDAKTSIKTFKQVAVTAPTQITITAPGAPSVSSITPTNQQAVLNWNAPANSGGSAITGYQIFRSTTPGAETLLTEVGNVTTYTNSGLTSGSTYYYKIAAKNSIGVGTQSTEAGVSLTAPSAPTMSITAGNKQAVLNWTPPASGGAPITNYEIYRSSVSGQETLLIETGNVLTYTDVNNLTNGSTYYYKLAAKNSVGIGAQSTEVKVILPTQPLTPQNLLATPSVSKVDLSWNTSTGATNYKIYKTTTQGSYSSAPIDNGNSTTYSDTNLNNGVTYYYKVAAENSMGTSNSTPEVSAVPIGGKYQSVEYVLAPTTQIITNPITHKSVTQTIDPDYTCTPYKISSAWEGQYVYAINYKKSFPTKADAINDTLTSLKNCLKISNSPAIGTTANYVIQLVGGFAPSFYDPAKTAYINNFKSKSTCTVAPINGSFSLLSNANNCAQSGTVTVSCIAGIGDICTTRPLYTGTARQIDFVQTMPETVHLRTTRCFNSTLINNTAGKAPLCTFADAIVPTYKYDGDLNPEITSINHGFQINWADLSKNVETTVYYDVAKKDANGNYNIIKNKTTDTSFRDDRLRDPSQIQYYQIYAYNSNNSAIALDRIDSSNMPGVKNEVSVTLNGVGFNLIKDSLNLPSTHIYMNNNTKNPAFIVSCNGFEYQDTNTLINGKCDITNAPTGEYDVVLEIEGTPYTLPKGFTVSYTQPTAISIENISSNLNDGVLKIGTVKGDNLYIGAIVGVKVNGNSSLNHYTLNNFDYDTNSFYCNDPVTCPDKLMKFDISDVMKLANGDLSKIELYLANDDGSLIQAYPSNLNNLGATCITSTWTWTDNLNASKVCPGYTTTRTSNCGEVVTEGGTMQCSTTNSICRGTECICIPLSLEQARAKYCKPNNYNCGMITDGCNITKVYSCNADKDGHCNSSTSCNCAP